MSSPKPSTSSFVEDVKKLPSSPPASRLKVSVTSPRKRRFDTMITEEESLYSFRNIDMGYENVIRMAECFERKFMCDVELMAMDKTIIPAHRIVLVAASDYFASRYKVDCPELDERLIVIDKVDGESLRLLIKYCYTGTIHVEKEKVFTILEAANHLILPELVQGCCSFLNEKAFKPNRLNIEAPTNKVLQNDTMQFICQNFTQIANTPEFLAMTKEELKCLLSAENLVAPDENHIYMKVKAWVLHDYPERVKMTDILDVVHLRLLSSYFLFDVVQLFHNSSKIQKVMIALEERMIHQNMQMLNDPNEKTRNYIHDKLLVIGGSDGNSAGYVEIYDAMNNQWFDIVNISRNLVNKKFFSVTAIKNYKQANQVLIVGGMDVEACDTVQLLDLDAKVLKPAAPMRYARYCLGTVGVHKGHNYFVYAMGGQVGNQCVDYVEKWDIVSQTWQDAPSLILGRAGFGTAVLKNKIYVAGGLAIIDNDLVSTSSVEAFSLETETWELSAPMYCARGNPGLVSTGEYLYALGGRYLMHGCLTSIEQYDPVTNTWCLYASLPKPRRDLSACYHRNKILTCGGIGDSGISVTEVYEYDLAKRRWKTLARIKHKRMAANFIQLPYFY